MEISQAMDLMQSKVMTEISVSLLKAGEKMAEAALALIPSHIGTNIDTSA